MLASPSGVQELGDALYCALHALAVWQWVGLDQRSCSTLSLVSSGMGDCLQAGKLLRPPGKLSLPSLRGR